MKLVKGKVTVEIKDNDKNKALKLKGFLNQGFVEVVKNSKGDKKPE